MQTLTDEDGRIHERILENGRVTRFRKWRSAIRALGMVE
jgi:hypothetical protein